MIVARALDLVPLRCGRLQPVRSLRLRDRNIAEWRFFVGLVLRKAYLRKGRGAH